MGGTPPRLAGRVAGIGSLSGWPAGGSMKNAPSVSPAQAKPAVLGMVPASCKPALKLYWSGVPLGQNPPPTTGDPVGSTHSSPMLLMPQKMRLTFMTPNTNAKRLVPRLLAARFGARPADATDAPIVAASSAPATPERAARINQVERISSLEVERPAGGARTRAPPSINRLEAQLEADANVPRRAVEVLHAAEQVVVGVERLGLLGQRVALVAVAEPRLHPLQHHTIHSRGGRRGPRRAVADVDRAIRAQLADGLSRRLVRQV